jgi:hypothetical protein
MIRTNHDVRLTKKHGSYEEIWSSFFSTLIHISLFNYLFASLNFHSCIVNFPYLCIFLYSCIYILSFFLCVNLFLHLLILSSCFISSLSLFLLLIIYFNISSFLFSLSFVIFSIYFLNLIIL